MSLHLYHSRKKKKATKPPSSSTPPPPNPSSPPPLWPSSPARAKFTSSSSICPKFILNWTSSKRRNYHQQQERPEQQEQMPGGEKELGRIMQLHREEEDQTARSSPSHTRTPSPRSLDGTLTLPLASSPAPPSGRLLPATLLCRRSDGRVLYMEAGKEVVDALLGLLALPLGAALRLLSAAGSPPRVAISALYTSALELDESLLCGDRDALVDPRPGLRPSDLFAPASNSASAPGHIYYKCSNHGCLRFVIDVPGQICPVCKFAMSHKLELIVPGKGAYPPPSPSPAASPLHGGGGSGDRKLLTAASKPPRSGFVKKNRTFIITDELEVLPMSTIRSVILLGKLKLDSLQDLESVQVTVGMTEMLELLKASMSSRTALNDVFRIKGVAALEN